MKGFLCKRKKWLWIILRKQLNLKIQLNLNQDMMKPKKAEKPEVSHEALKTEVKKGKSVVNESPIVMGADESSISERKPRMKIPGKPDMDKLRSSNQSRNDDEFVKKRLDSLKESYIENAQDIESIIDERLDSFKGTLGKLKTESKEPGIIWSFDAGDVQEAMRETIPKLIIEY